jgi:hypothetical protein
MRHYGRAAGVASAVFVVTEILVTIAITSDGKLPSLHRQVEHDLSYRKAPNLLLGVFLGAHECRYEKMFESVKTAVPFSRTRCDGKVIYRGPTTAIRYLCRSWFFNHLRM